MHWNCILNTLRHAVKYANQERIFRALHTATNVSGQLTQAFPTNRHLRHTAAFLSTINGPLRAGESHAQYMNQRLCTRLQQLELQIQQAPDDATRQQLEAQRVLILDMLGTKE